MSASECACGCREVIAQMTENIRLLTEGMGRIVTVQGHLLSSIQMLTTLTEGRVLAPAQGPSLRQRLGF